MSACRHEMAPTASFRIPKVFNGMSTRFYNDNVQFLFLNHIRMRSLPAIVATYFAFESACCSESPSKKGCSCQLTKSNIYS